MSALRPLPLLALALSVSPSCDGFGRNGCTNSYFPSELTIALDHDDWAEGTWTFALDFDGRTVNCAITLGAGAETGDTGSTTSADAVRPDTAFPSWTAGTCDDTAVSLVQIEEGAVETIKLWDLTPAEITVRVALDGVVLKESTAAPDYVTNPGKTSSCTGSGSEGYITVSF